MYISEKKLLKWALCCNAIYVFLFFLVRPQGINILKISITLFLIISVLILLMLSVRNVKQIKQIPKFSRWLFYMIMFWGIITIVRGLSFSVQDLVTNFGNVYMGWAWVLPMALIIGLKIENWSIVFKVINFIFQLMILAFLISLSFSNSYLQWAWLLRPVNFLLIIGLYRYAIITKIKIFIIIGIYIIVASIVKQRMDLLFLTITLCFLLMDKLFSIRVRRTLIKYILVGFVIVFIIIFTLGYENVSGVLSSIIEFQDSRTFLFIELMSDLDFYEKIVGRGSLGTYFSEFMAHTKWYTIKILKQPWWGDASIRITTEVGYLQMILKGGFILLSLNFMFFMFASYIAIFKSNNKFTKRLGYYILIISMLTMVSMRPTFAPTFIILWMAIGTVLSKKYRNMTDSEVEALIKFK